MLSAPYNRQNNNLWQPIWLGMALSMVEIRLCIIWKMTTSHELLTTIKYWFFLFWDEQKCSAHFVVLFRKCSKYDEKSFHFQSHRFYLFKPFSNGYTLCSKIKKRPIHARIAGVTRRRVSQREWDKSTLT